MTTKPLGDRVLVLPADPSRKIGSILLPESAVKQSQEGTVIAIGSSDKIEVKPGDRVLYNKYGGTDIELDGKIHKILPQQDIMAVVN